MMGYSVLPRNRIFVKGYGFLAFAKSMGKNIGKNVSKNLSGKYSQKLLDHAKQSATDAFKTTKEEATGDLIGNKIGNRVTKVSKNSPQNNSETVTNEPDKEILKKDMYLQQKERKLLMI